jgi:hypothetical protein
MVLQAFSVDRVTDQRSAQVMNPVNKMASTEDPRKRKIILLLAGIEPGSPSCESNVLPLDHGLPPHNAKSLQIDFLKKKHFLHSAGNVITMFNKEKSINNGKDTYHL